MPPPDTENPNPVASNDNSDHIARQVETFVLDEPPAMGPFARLFIAAFGAVVVLGAVYAVLAVISPPHNQ